MNTLNSATIEEYPVPLRHRRSPYVKSAATAATTHQLTAAADEILEMLTRDMAGLLPLHPSYQTLQHNTQRLLAARDNLCFVRTARKRKSTTDVRPVGGQPLNRDDVYPAENVNDSDWTATNLSDYKREIYQRRRSQMRRMRSKIRWYLSDPDQDLFPEDLENKDLEAAELLRDLLNQRISDFESESYQESKPEFKYFFEAIDESPALQDALRQLKLDRVYANLKMHQQTIDDLYRQQTAYESNMARLPRMIDVERDLRRAFRALFSFMNFDYESGRDALQPYLARFTAIIGRMDTVGKMRETRKEKELALEQQKECMKDSQSAEVSKDHACSKDTSIKPAASPGPTLDLTDLTPSLTPGPPSTQAPGQAPSQALGGTINPHAPISCLSSQVCIRQNE